jgi:hypothetical protein
MIMAAQEHTEPERSRKIEADPLRSPESDCGRICPHHYRSLRFPPVPSGSLRVFTDLSGSLKIFVIIYTESLLSNHPYARHANRRRRRRFGTTC